MENVSKTLLEEVTKLVANKEEEKPVMTITGRTPGKSMSSVFSRPYGRVPADINLLGEICLGTLRVLQGMVTAAKTEQELRQITVLLLPIMNEVHARHKDHVTLSPHMLERRIAEIFSGSMSEMRHLLLREIDYHEREARSMVLPRVRSTDDVYDDMYAQEITKIWTQKQSVPIPSKLPNAALLAKSIAEDAEKIALANDGTM